MKEWSRPRQIWQRPSGACRAKHLLFLACVHQHTAKQQNRLNEFRLRERESGFIFRNSHSDFYERSAWIERVARLQRVNACARMHTCVCSSCCRKATQVPPHRDRLTVAVSRQPQRACVRTNPTERAWIFQTPCLHIYVEQMKALEMLITSFRNSVCMFVDMGTGRAWLICRCVIERERAS